jgi:hypothetical protein
MLEYLAAQDHVKRTIRFRYIHNIADQINLAGIPFPGLQASGITSSFVLTNVLRKINQMRAQLFVPQFTGAGVQYQPAIDCGPLRWRLPR